MSEDVVECAVYGHWPTAEEVGVADDLDPLEGLGVEELVATLRGLEAILAPAERRYLRAKDVAPHAPQTLDNRQVGRALAYLADVGRDELGERYAIPVRMTVERWGEGGGICRFEVVRHG